MNIFRFNHSFLGTYTSKSFSLFLKKSIGLNSQYCLIFLLCFFSAKDLFCQVENTTDKNYPYIQQVNERKKFELTLFYDPSFSTMRSIENLPEDYYFVLKGRITHGGGVFVNNSKGTKTKVKVGLSVITKALTFNERNKFHLSDPFSWIEHNRAKFVFAQLPILLSSHLLKDDKKIITLDIGLSFNRFLYSQNKFSSIMGVGRNKDLRYSFLLISEDHIDILTNLNFQKVINNSKRIFIGLGLKYAITSTEYYYLPAKALPISFSLMTGFSLTNLSLNSN